MASGFRITMATICLILSLLVLLREGIANISIIEFCWYSLWLSVSLLSRRWSWNLYCFSLAFLIDQWGTLHGYLLALSTLSLLSGDFFRSRVSVNSHDGEKLHLLGFMTLFIALSAVWTIISDIPLLYGYFAAAGYSITALSRFVTFIPTDQGYQFIASFQLLVACIISFRLTRLVRDSAIERLELIRWLFWGVSATVVFGYFEFVGLISLDYFRHTNPYVQLSDTHRFLSLSGHPGWFALYVTILVPPIFWYLTSDNKQRGQSTAGRFIEWLMFVLTLIAIIMTLQIGAWIALAGLVLWIGVCARGQTGGMSDRKKRIHLPVFARLIMIASGLACLFFIMVRLFFKYEGSIVITAKLRHRFLLWLHGYEMWLDHPLVGTGTGSFGFEYSIRFPPWAVDFVQFHSSAHSTFLQNLFEQGVPGFLVLCFIPVIYIFRGRILVRNLTVENQALYTWSAGSMVVFFLFSLTQHYFYISAVLMVFWIIVGLASDVGPSDASPQVNTTNMRCFTLVQTAIAIILCLFLLTLLQNYLWGPRFNGLYQLEMMADGSQHYRWTAGSTTIAIPPNSSVIDLKLQIVEEILARNPTEVRIGLDGTELTKVIISDSQPRTFSYRLTQKNPRQLTIISDRVVCPWLREISTDRRILGVCIVRLSFNGVDNYWNSQANKLRRQPIKESRLLLKLLNALTKGGQPLVP